MQGALFYFRRFTVADSLLLSVPHGGARNLLWIDFVSGGHSQLCCIVALLTSAIACRLLQMAAIETIMEIITCTMNSIISGNEEEFLAAAVF